jgi:3-deoxy-manno-octulosonate cytidylyltransferase (CMP-KDO synthetase)
MSVVAIIPARYGSTRLPGKPLALIGGKPMVQHVYESTAKARGLDRVLVATDDRRIERVVRSFGGEAVITSRRHRSGTDRLAEVARKLRADWLVNVQGDLPFIAAATIGGAIEPVRRKRDLVMSTVCTAIYDIDEWRNPNVVKVVRAPSGFALYFSRAPIPCVREAAVSRQAGGHSPAVLGYRHLGLYVYRRDFLLKLSRLPTGPLEQAESLEQLRVLENGYRIYVTEVEEHSIEVDTPADLKQAGLYWRANN